MISLRQFEPKDEHALVTILNDTNVVRYLSTKIPFPYTNKDALWWIEEGSKSGVIKAVELNGECVGCIGVTPGEFEYSRSGELGYWLSAEHWGKGLMKQAVEQITEIVFETTNIVRIFAVVFADNQASKRVLVKSGFEQEAVLRSAIYKNEQFYDNYIFTKLNNKQPY